MAKFDVVDLDLKKVSEIELSDDVFAAEPNEYLIYEVAKMQQINRRRGTVAVKNTSLVSGGGKKPWKQKGTGRARQGSIRASQWVGGGKAMGPKPRDYFYRPPRKVRRGAICAALAMRAKEHALIIVDSFKLESAKTKNAQEVLTRRLKLEDALVVDEKTNQNLHRSVRNLAQFDVLPPEVSTCSRVGRPNREAENHGNQKIQANFRGAPVDDRLRLCGDHQGPAGKEAHRADETMGRSQCPRPHHPQAQGRGAQPPLSRARLQPSRQGARSRQGRAN